MNDKEEINLLFTQIEQMRLYKGIKKKDLANATDITPQYYSELLAGKKGPALSIVLRMLDVLDAKLVVTFK